MCLLYVPLIAISCTLHAVLEEGANKIHRDLSLAQHVLRVLLGCFWRRLLVVKRGLPRDVTVASVLVTSVVSRARPLLARGGLAAIGAPRTTVATQVLMGELLGQAIGSFVETGSVGSLQIPLLSLVLGLLVRVHEVASAIAIVLLCAPNLLLTCLVGVDGLGKGRGRGRKSTTRGFLVVLAITTAKTKGEIQAIALLLVVHGG